MEKAKQETFKYFFADLLLEEIAEVEVERRKRSDVPPSRLTIKCNTREVDNFKIENVLDDYKTNLETFKPSKWKVKVNKRKGATIDITISVKDEYPPITLTHYQLRSSNLFQKYDPVTWALYPLSDKGKLLRAIHVQNSEEEKKQWQPW